MRRHIYAAILLGTGKAKHMVIFIDRAADRAQRIMAVCQDIGNGKLLKARRPCRLDDSYKRNVMGSQLIKFNLKPLHVP